jgi:spore cortex formation protein SpoVR/YcgB (stage V sporulation)
MKELVEDLELYLYDGRKEAGEIKCVISESDWRWIKSPLVSHLRTFDIPLIMVKDVNYNCKRQLYTRYA